MRPQILAVGFVAVCLATSSAFAIDEYRLDDGVGDQNIGVTGGGGQ